MNKFIFAFVAFAITLVNASSYGHASSGYGAGYAPAPVAQRPAVLYNIPPPHVINPLPAALGDVYQAVNIGNLKAGGATGSLIGAGSNPSASASAASANTPLRAGSYTLLVVPSYAVPNAVVPSGGAAHYGGASGYGTPAAAY